MSSKRLIAKFKVDQHQFILSLCEYEMMLELVQHAEMPQSQMRGKAWLNFEDEPRIDDVNQQIDAFQVMIECRRLLLAFLKRHPMPYFYFHASTARKARIYPRFAQQLQAQLENYHFCQNDQSFYFYQNS